MIKTTRKGPELIASVCEGRQMITRRLPLFSPPCHLPPDAAHALVVRAQQAVDKIGTGRVSRSRLCSLSSRWRCSSPSSSTRPSSRWILWTCGRSSALSEAFGVSARYTRNRKGPNQGAQDRTKQKQFNVNTRSFWSLGASSCPVSSWWPFLRYISSVFLCVHVRSQLRGGVGL